MSDTKRTDSRIDDMDFSALDRELAQMAEETPDVPADFHASWVQKIREEAQAGEKPAVPDEGKASRREALRRQRKYILSAAAAIVLLVGGVAITRNNPGNRSLQTPVQTAQPETKRDEAPAETGEYEEAADMEEAREADGAAVTYMETAMEEAWETDGTVMADMETAMEESARADAEAEMSAEEDDAFALGAYPDAGEPREDETNTASGTAVMAAGIASGSAGETAAKAEKAGTKAAEANAEEAPEPVPAHTSGPTAEPTAEPTAKPAAEEPAAETAVEEPEPFLQSVWTFLLDAAPWILGGVIIILFLVTYVFHIGGKQ